MKKINKTVAVIISVILCALVLTSCGAKQSAPSSTQAKTEAKAKTITVVVIDKEGKAEDFTFETEKDNLADALLERDFISGDNGEYGIYIKTVNGIRADYDLDNAYWSISKGGEALTTGANDVIIADGEQYEFTYTAA